jgi:hypothetical protein
MVRDWGSSVSSLFECGFCLGNGSKGYRYRISSVALLLFQYEGFEVFLATLATIPSLAPHILRSPYRSRDQVSFYVPLFIPLTLGLAHVLWLVMCIYSLLPCLDMITAALVKTWITRVNPILRRNSLQIVL